MIENNLLKTNFTGKDGFRWWIGQVAPESAQGSQIQEIGDAWGTRVKVRIFGYHPPDVTELANDDLVYVLVETNNQQNQALNNFNNWGINTNNVIFISTNTYSHWTRDHGPEFLIGDEGFKVINLAEKLQKYAESYKSTL